MEKKNYCSGICYILRLFYPIFIPFTFESSWTVLEVLQKTRNHQWRIKMATKLWRAIPKLCAVILKLDFLRRTIYHPNFIVLALIYLELRRQNSPWQKKKHNTRENITKRGKSVRLKHKYDNWLFLFDCSLHRRAFHRGHHFPMASGRIWSYYWKQWDGPVWIQGI